MFKKILVATDGSEYSNRALKVALECGKCFGADIMLLFVFTQPRSYGTFSGLQSVEFSDEQIDEISKKVFSATINGNDVSAADITKKIKVGYPASVILEEVKDGVGMIIMGSRGHSPVSGVVTGSVTQKVLGLAPCPVMVVK